MILWRMLLSCVFKKSDGSDVSVQVHRCRRFTLFLLCTLALFMKTKMRGPIFTLYFAYTLRTCKLYEVDTLARVAQPCVQ